jgi:Xaa-Pro aminopeptidase
MAQENEMIREDWKGRMKRTSMAARRAGVQAVLATHPNNIRYLLGAGDARFALVGSGIAAVMPFGLGAEVMKEKAPSCWMIMKPDMSWKPLQKLLASKRVYRLGIESSTLSMALHGELSRALALDAVLVPVPGIIEGVRQVKDAGEIAILRRAGAVTGRVAEEMPGVIRAGVSEREIAGWIDRRMLELGADGPAFETIVLAAERSALPHGKPTGRRFANGDLLLADFGARLDGYHTDATRVFAVGRSDARQRRIYAAVYRAYVAGRRKTREGRSAGESDRAARAALRDLAPRFIHTLGHGLGLDIHEGFRLASGSKQRVQSGMVLTIEPGVYMPGWGGVRLEDTYLIARVGPVSLTGAPSPALPKAGALR